MINDSRIVLGDYDISIDSVKRNLHESMFTLVANTSVSHLSRSFSILVHCEFNLMHFVLIRLHLKFNEVLTL